MWSLFQQCGAFHVRTVEVFPRFTSPSIAKPVSRALLSSTTHYHVQEASRGWDTVQTATPSPRVSCCWARAWPSCSSRAHHSSHAVTTWPPRHTVTRTPPHSVHYISNAQTLQM
ncbi:hypothetical protein E2C01_077224 [Portunus trituberculatus]|uniref:Uncharacterized protein n=1 Tax=Portunus trituberculatus TaxID=210409 RepID=A0A5B7IAV2_PORTR|nr:hypothetical protein [Portunus trituberculatus]